MTRRTLVVTLDPKCERPELRGFEVDPPEVARARRGEFVAVTLTIVRAYLHAKTLRAGDRVGRLR